MQALAGANQSHWHLGAVASSDASKPNLMAG